MIRRVKTLIRFGCFRVQCLEESVFVLLFYTKQGQSIYHSLFISEEEFLCRSSLKGRERAIVKQTNIGTIFKGNVEETYEGTSGAHMGFSEHIDIILN